VKAKLPKAQITRCWRCQGQIPEARQRRHARYCSKKCQLEAHLPRSIYKQHGLSANKVTTMMKLRVSADLIARGCHVFRSINTSSGADLGILVPHNNQFLRVAIRTGIENPSTKKIYVSRPSEGSYDICAVVLPNETIYEPAPNLKLARRNRALPPLQLP
jgi:hypothetical protein